MSVTEKTTQTTQERLGRPFGIHLGGVGLANLADGIILGGVPLIAISLTRSPGEISMLQVAFWLPWLLLGVVAGVVVDRADRRHVQLVGAAIRILVCAAMLVLLLTGRLTMPVLIAGVGLYGITQVFVDLAGSSIVPSLAPRSRLSAANGRVMGLEQVCTSFVGAPLAGLLLVLGAGWILGVPVALGVAFLLLIGLGLRGDYRASKPVGQAASTKFQEIAEGLRFQFVHPVLRPMVISSSLANLANTGYFAVFILWVVGPGSRVGMEPQHYPLLAAAIAAGAVAGSILAERLARATAEVPLLLACWAINACLLLVPVLVPQVWAIGVAFVLMGLTNMIANVIGRTLRQRLIPADKLGRVGGAAGMIGYGLMPLGALLGGLVGEAWGLPAVFFGAVAICLAAVVYAASRISTKLVAAHELDPAPAPDRATTGEEPQPADGRGATVSADGRDAVSHRARGVEHVEDMRPDHVERVKFEQVRQHR